MRKPPTRPYTPRRQRGDIQDDSPDIKTWAAPLAELVAGDDLYHLKYKAVEMWWFHARAVQIQKDTGFTAARARRWVHKCLERDPQTDKVFGFWALISDTSLRPQLSSEKGKGRGRELTQLFQRYPALEADMCSFAKRRRTENTAPAAVFKPHILHAFFWARCQELGLKERGEWPFDKVRRGAKAITTWYKNRRFDHPVHTASNEAGDDAGKLTNSDYKAIGHQKLGGRLLCYERVELDEQYLDADFSVISLRDDLTPYADFATRLWSLMLVECRSKVVLSSGISYGQKYGRNDVLKVVHRALAPPGRLNLHLQSPHFAYKELAAYPGELPHFRRNTWQLLALDNDAAHKSAETDAMVEAVVGCHVARERIGTGQARAHIEGLHGILARLMQMLPSATGNHPKSPARRDPSAAAKRYNLFCVLVAEIYDVLVRNRNATPLQACGGLSPLQLAQELLVQGEMFRSPLGDLRLDDRLWQLLPRYRATLSKLRGDVGTGPHGVALFSGGGRYVSRELANNNEVPYLKDKNVWVYVQEDARFAYVVPDAAPSKVFEVVLKGQFADIPHTLDWRRLSINAAKNSAIGGTADSPQVMYGVLHALGENAERGNGAAALLNGTTAFIEQYGSGNISFISSTPSSRDALLEGVRDIQIECGEVEEQLDLRKQPTAKAPFASFASTLRPQSGTSPTDPFGLLK